MVGVGTIGRGGTDSDRSRGSIGFAVDGTGHCHHTRVGIDRKASAIIVEERVSDGIGSAIGIGRRRGNSDDRSHGRVFIDCIGSGIGVGNGTHIELIHIVDADRKVLVGVGTIGRGGTTVMFERLHRFHD